MFELLRNFNHEVARKGFFGKLDLSKHKPVTSWWNKESEGIVEGKEDTYRK